ncbi:MAG: hypothetical protein GXX79_14915, partial [Actinomycetales bacterium]|nr:hypothetical protein [Actinomycetales bacterium]
QASAAALESAKGVLRSEVGRRTGVRLTPTLDFVADSVGENAAHIEDLLRTAAARDADVAALAASAVPAGDADPYRKPSVEDPEESEGPGDAGPGSGGGAGPAAGAGSAGDTGPAVGAGASGRVGRAPGRPA